MLIRFYSLLFLKKNFKFRFRVVDKIMQRFSVNYNLNECMLYRDIMYTLVDFTLCRGPIRALLKKVHLFKHVDTCRHS